MVVRMIRKTLLIGAENVKAVYYGIFRIIRCVVQGFQGTPAELKTDQRLLATVKHGVGDGVIKSYTLPAFEQALDGKINRYLSMATV